MNAKKFLARQCSGWDLEEGLISAGILLLASGVWMTWGPGLALTVTGALLLGLGCVIAFWR